MTPTNTADTSLSRSTCREVPRPKNNETGAASSCQRKPRFSYVGDRGGFLLLDADHPEEPFAMAYSGFPEADVAAEVAARNALEDAYRTYGSPAWDVLRAELERRGLAIAHYPRDFDLYDKGVLAQHPDLQAFVWAVRRHGCGTDLIAPGGLLAQQGCFRTLMQSAALVFTYLNGTLREVSSDEARRFLDNHRPRVNLQVACEGAD
jgi:hypothetical protein